MLFVEENLIIDALHALPSNDKVYQNRRPSSIHWTQTIVNSDSWLRALGFYGSLTLVTPAEDERRFQIHIGFKPPSWLVSSSIGVRVELSKFIAPEMGGKTFRWLNQHTEPSS